MEILSGIPLSFGVTVWATDIFVIFHLFIQEYDTGFFIDV